MITAVIIGAKIAACFATEHFSNGKTQFLSHFGLTLTDDVLVKRESLSGKPVSINSRSTNPIKPNLTT